MGFRESILRRLPDRDKLRRSFLFRVFGKSILARDLWCFDTHSLAGGLSLGLFIAFTPTIPFQMILACLGALYFRVNLPIALLACWVTNPITAVPIYMTAWRIGGFVLHMVPWADDYVAIYGEGRRARIIMGSFCLWTGCLVMATAAALAGNLLVRWLWKGVHLHWHGRGQPAESNPQPSPRSDKIVGKRDSRGNGDCHRPSMQ